MKYRILTTLIIALTVFSSFAVAEDENYEINWFYLMNYAGRMNDLPTGFGYNNSDWALGEQRVRMDVTAWSETIEAEARLKIDFFHDSVFDEYDIEIREAYLDYTWEDFDFRLGRQVITWGVGELVFINDIWPKNWESFFTGRPMEYLKTGVDGARIRYSGDGLSAELVVLPTFEPDQTPTAQRFSYFDPFVSFPNRVTEEPESTFENAEVALRVYTNFAGFDVSGYFYKGFWHEPGFTFDNFMAPTEMKLFYPELNVYGASAQGNMAGGILSLEFGYYDSTDDEEGLDPTIKNSEIRYLIGYSRQLVEDLYVGVQYFHKEFQDYDNYLLTLPMGMPVSEDYRNEVTLSIRQMLMDQKMTIYIFGYYSPVDEDYYFLPSVTYKVSDEMAVTLGANLFGGEDNTTFLGQFEDNDNLYVSIRYDF